MQPDRASDATNRRTAAGARISRTRLKSSKPHFLTVIPVWRSLGARPLPFGLGKDQLLSRTSYWLAPLVWLFLLPFRVVGIAVEGALSLVWAIVTLPARLLRAL